MKNIENIDGLIKKGMDGFNPTPPPDAWNFIEQQVQSPVNGASANGGKQFLQALKQMSLLGKVITAVSLPLIGTGLYFALSSEPKKPEAEAQQALVQQSITEAKEQKTETENLPLVQDKKATVKQALKSNSRTAEPDAIKNPEPEINPNNSQPSNNSPAVSVQTENNRLATDNKEINKGAKEEAKKNVPLLNSGKKANQDAGSMENNYPEPELNNAFSPDGDGKNDTWEINIDNLSFAHLSVFDSKGQLVFETDQLSNFWNGTNAKTGMDCEAGVYFYEIKYQYAKAEKSHTKNGVVNLVR